ncbi:MAG: AAA family ATPase [Spirochaetales bacterium]|nr:AAA family ATPase [Spirochaetales bacterium]
MDLFSQNDKSTYKPLAARMRPRILEEYVGQDHILAPGRLLRRAIQMDQLSSIIFYGPPGTGKTTLAMVIANTTKSTFVSINAVLSGVKQIRETIEEAKERRKFYDQKTILFVDEVHRWNKAQQDALLPWVENGTVILIGATIENPYFEVNRALVSRSRIFQLKSLEESDLRRIVQMALNDDERGYGKYKVVIDDDALAHFIRISNGDARNLLNALELAIETTPAVFPPKEGEEVRVTLEIAEQSIQKKALLYDKEGDYHFDIISAFIKSLRGSDPDAALYWLARMVGAGEDPHFIFRRMLILACEDVGLADPNAITVVLSCAQAFDRIGLPEGRFHLAHAALYLSTCPKSNSALAFFDALAFCEQEGDADVPNPLKDGSRDKEGFGHGEGYLYPHAYRDHWVAQQYLPRALQGKVFYKPSSSGYEAGIKEDVERRRELQLSLMMEEEPDEVLSFTKPDSARDRWYKRATELKSSRLIELRERIFAPLKLKRQDRVLDLNAGSGLLLWEALRRVPEGAVYGLVLKQEEKDLLLHYADALSELEKPILLSCDITGLIEQRENYLEGNVFFESIVGRNGLTKITDKKKTAAGLYSLSIGKGLVSLCEIIPCRTTRLSSFIGENVLNKSIMDKIKEIEENLYSDAGNPLVNWNEEDLCSYLTEGGFKLLSKEIIVLEEERKITDKHIKRWFSSESQEPNYGVKLKEIFNKKDYNMIVEKISGSLTRLPVKWYNSYLSISLRKEVKYEW